MSLTVCPRSLDPFNSKLINRITIYILYVQEVVSYYIEWATTSWTDSINTFRNEMVQDFLDIQYMYA